MQPASPMNWYSKLATRLSSSRTSTSSSSGASGSTSLTSPDVDGNERMEICQSPLPVDDELDNATAVDGETTPPGLQSPSAALTSSLQRLPAELWLNIFALVTTLPHDPLATVPARGCSPSWDERDYDAGLRVPLYTRVQGVRLSLALVSRSFCALVLPELYAYAWLHRRSQARRLALTLTMYPQRGHWVRRLDIDCLATKRDAMQASALDVKVLLAACAPGLVSLLDRRGTYVNVGDPAAHWGAMLAPLSALRRVRITHYGERARFAAVLAPLTRLGALEVLELDLGLMDFTHYDDESSSGGLEFSFPHLHTLELALGQHAGATDSFLSSILDWRIPALTTLRILGNFAATPALHDMLASHGAGILVLELGAPADIWHNATWSIDEELLPALDVLICTASRAYSIPHPLVRRHAHLRHIRFRLLERKVRDQHSTTVLSQLAATFPSAGAFPSLTEIRSLTYGESPVSRMTRDSEVLILQLFWKRLVEAAARETPRVRIADLWGRDILLPVGEAERAWGTPSSLARGEWSWP